MRCLTVVEIRPSLGFNLVCGPNGHGKTSLLEGVHLVSTGRLWRGSKDSQAIQEGMDQAAASATLTPSGTEVAVHLARGAKKKATLNGLSLPRASDLLGRLPTVSFSAEDLEIVRGDPAARRSFLDEELAQIYPAYLRHLAQYKRALEQRNALLKLARDQWPGAAVFEPWEELLAQHGSEIRRYRVEWVDQLRQGAREAHQFLGGGEDLELAYDARDALAEGSDFARSRSEDIARGSTSLGPHRDEMVIQVKGLEARHFGSQGQQRTAVIALKLAVQSLAKRVFGHPPVLLLDDVFSDLDASRRARLMEFALTEGGQVFLTCTEAEMAGEELARRSQVFLVQSGVVAPQ